MSAETVGTAGMLRVQKVQIVRLEMARDRALDHAAELRGKYGPGYQVRVYKRCVRAASASAPVWVVVMVHVR